ncbi:MULTISPECIES: carboxymuconolactone decarboxylase family protein [unclassified Lentilitoribacter]|jgi:AhpD family alkylhydroperoxidase|uniref:carboxymuconolactone decarboxylase family protein n=1 Tax=unclassified Lentilitoribacter TaxID=2647570 RepID=UPI0013A69C47|nr:carboxymuconolactone decarboxylase family protein [Lentilitoribacter sp. Alg239-R112]
MKTRLNFAEVAPDGLKAIYGMEQYVSGKSGLDPKLIHLLKLRVSQINGCVYCVDMHTKEAREDGLSEQWIALVCVWREAEIFTDRERALLAWAEALTLLSETGAPDEDYENLLKNFTKEECVNLSLAVSTINVWNRMAVGFRMQPEVS